MPSSYACLITTVLVLFLTSVFVEYFYILTEFAGPDSSLLNTLDPTPSLLTTNRVFPETLVKYVVDQQRKLQEIDLDWMRHKTQ